MGGDLAAAKDVLDDGLSIDREGKRPAYAGIAEWSFGHVKPDEVAFERGLDAKQVGRLGLVGINLAQRQVPSGVQLAGAKSEFLALQ